MLTKRLQIGTGTAARDIACLQRAGAEPGLVWLGGFRSDMTGTKALAVDELGATLGLSVTRFDYSGHGASGGPFEEGTISRWLEESLGVIDALTAGDLILVGSSMGGWLALLVAQALARAAETGRSRIRGLVLIAPAPDFTEKLMWAGFPQGVRDTIMAEGRYPVPSAYSSDPYVITRALIEDGRKHQLLDGTIEVGCPVHILQGRLDPDVPWTHAERLVDRLVHDDVTLTFVNDGDHRLSRPQDLDLLARTIRAMVADAKR